MRGLAILGAVIGGVMLAGCSSQGQEHESAWKNIVAEEYSEARAKYESILAEDPTNPYANLNIGVSYEELGDTEMAKQHYRVAIEHGEEAEIGEVAQDGSTALRSTTVRKVATENLARLGG